MTQNHQTELSRRESLQRDTLTPAERVLFCTLLITLPVASWLADPRSFWVLGFFLIAGVFGPFTLRTHQLTHPFHVDKLWRRAALLSAPVIIGVLQYSAGLWQNPVVHTAIDKQAFLSIKEVNHALPISTAASQTWLPALAMASVYLVAMNLLMIPKSRSFFERLLPWLCLNAVLIALIGCLQKVLQLPSALFTKGTGQDDFFAFFPYDGHWAAFAALWSAVCISMALLVARYQQQQPFLQTVGPWYLAGGTLLGGSGFLVHAHWPATILLGICAVLLLVVTITFLSQSQDPNRTSIALGSGLIAIGSFAGCIFRFFQADAYSASATALRRSALEMFYDSPLFGWGMESFTHLIPFYADDRLLLTRHQRASSDVLQLLAEIGVCGCLPLVLLPIWLVIRYFISGQQGMRLTNHMLLGCAAVLVLACVDSPFMSPAVCLSFLIVLFAALRWADLSRSQVDEVDAQPHLVIDPSKRRVPFFNQPQDNAFK